MRAECQVQGSDGQTTESGLKGVRSGLEDEIIM